MVQAYTINGKIVVVVPLLSIMLLMELDMVRVALRSMASQLTTTSLPTSSNGVKVANRLQLYRLSQHAHQCPPLYSPQKRPLPRQLDALMIQTGSEKIMPLIIATLLGKCQILAANGKIARE